MPVFLAELDRYLFGARIHGSSPLDPPEVKLEEAAAEIASLEGLCLG